MTFAAALAMASGFEPIFPSIRGSLAENTQASGNNFVVTLPSHQIGDLLLVFVSAEGTGDISEASGTWDRRSYGIDGDVRAGVFAKHAESASETLTIDNSANNANIQQISFAVKDSFYEAPASTVSTNELASATNTGGNPPNLTPTWGSAKNLWFAAIMTDNANISGTPANYTAETNNTPTAARLSVGYRQLEAASEDPDSFSGPSGANRFSMTLAVRPAS